MMRPLLSTGLSLALLGLALPALADDGHPRVAKAEAPDAPVSAEVPDARPAAPVREERRGLPARTISFDGGVRMNIVTDDGFDPYSDRDLLPQASIGAGFVVLGRGPLSLGVRAGWDLGVVGATPRGTSTTLTVHRLGLGPEARYAFAPWLAAYVRTSAAAIHLRGTIDEPGFDRPLHARTWAFGLDAIGGLAFRIGRFGRDATPAAELWLTAEAGYGFAGEADMVFTPASVPDETRHFGDTVLPPLRAAGPTNRFALALTF